MLGFLGYDEALSRRAQRLLLLEHAVNGRYAAVVSVNAFKMRYAKALSCGGNLSFRNSRSTSFQSL